MRNALQYKEVILELFEAIDEYRSEFENPVPCGVMKKTHRDKIFRLADEIKSMGRPPPTDTEEGK